MRTDEEIKESFLRRYEKPKTTWAVTKGRKTLYFVVEGTAMARVDQGYLVIDDTAVFSPEAWDSVHKVTSLSSGAQV